MPGLTTELDSYGDVRSACSEVESDSLFNDRYGGRSVSLCDPLTQSLLLVSRSGPTRTTLTIAVVTHCAPAVLLTRYEERGVRVLLDFTCRDCGRAPRVRGGRRRLLSHCFDGSLPNLPVIDPYRVEVPEIEGRPARLCSLEQELVAGGASGGPAALRGRASLPAIVHRRLPLWW